MAQDAPVGSLTRQYVKLCDAADFDDPELLAAISGILPERDPAAHVERKVWEFAMCALFLRDAGHLRDATELLVVGAGDDRLSFWLANHVGHVVATDIYGHGRFAQREGARSMLEDPASHAPFPYREDHLDVLWMDGRDLAFADGDFDVVVPGGRAARVCSVVLAVPSLPSENVPSAEPIARPPPRASAT